MRLLASSGGGELELGAYRVAGAWQPCQVIWEGLPAYADMQDSVMVGTQSAGLHVWDVTALVGGWWP